MMQEVGRFVDPARPRSSFDGTKQYGTVASSQRTGTCESTSMGEMSPAIITRL